MSFAPDLHPSPLPPSLVLSSSVFVFSKPLLVPSSSRQLKTLVDIEISLHCFTPNAQICNRRLAAPFTIFLLGPGAGMQGRADTTGRKILLFRRRCRINAQSRIFTTSLITSAPYWVVGMETSLVRRNYDDSDTIHLLNACSALFDTSSGTEVPQASLSIARNY
ncbi:hypothetical protein R3P38DRAFT_3194815 [Favolaschia claudopus]|uniref:Uncharacterized protein n=1 Tax=Favolaschia claudopus TaxID=2862362 RepID=A0AAW0BEV5_9AGAR